MKKGELDNFYNRGFGWTCKKCEARLEVDINEKSRLMTEGESESKQPIFSNKAMAKWADEKQNTLICTTCKRKEKIS